MNHKVEIRTLLKGKIIGTEYSILPTKAGALKHVEQLRAFWAAPIKRKTLEVVYAGETKDAVVHMFHQGKAVDAAKAKRIASGDERVCERGHIHATPDDAKHCGESASDRSARIAARTPPSAPEQRERSTTRGSAGGSATEAPVASGSASRGSESEGKPS